MNDLSDSILSKIATGVGVAAAAAVGIGLGLLCTGARDRGSRTTQRREPEIDTSLAIAAVLDRLDRIEARLGADRADLAPVENSIADLAARLAQQEKSLEALKRQMGDVRQKEADEDISRLSDLFVRMKHPLFDTTSELTH